MDFFALWWAPVLDFCLPSRKLTYPQKIGIFEDDVPFPKVGYVNPLEGTLFVLFVALSAGGF